MRLLIASDLHGSLPAAVRLAALVAANQPQALVLLGDILYHGPRNPLPQGYDPTKTAECLNAIPVPVIAVAGNCDAEVDQMLLTFQLAPAFAWIFAEGLRIMAVHGHHHTPEACEQNRTLAPGDVLLAGHTHLPEARTHGTLRVWNPGSLALPKGGFPPSHGIFSDGRFAVIGPDGAPITEETF